MYLIDALIGNFNRHGANLGFIENNRHRLAPIYDRLEWLIRTDLRAAIDNLIVERAGDVKKTMEITSYQ